MWSPGTSNIYPYFQYYTNTCYFIINKLRINSIGFLIRTLNKKRKKNVKVPSGTKSSLFMNHTAYLTLQEQIFQISSQSVKPFNLEVGEHRDIES